MMPYRCDFFFCSTPSKPHPNSSDEQISSSVIFADGRDNVGIHQTGFHEVQLPVKLDAFLCEFGFRQPCLLERCRGECPLVRKVMDGEDGFDVLKERIVVVNRFDVRGDEAGLPIVAMNDVRLPPEPLQRLKNAAAEKDEADIVIRVVFFTVGARIDSGPLVHLLICEEIDLNFRFYVSDERRVDVCNLLFISDGDVNIFQADNIMELKFPLADGAVSRHNNADLVS